MWQRWMPSVAAGSASAGGHDRVGARWHGAGGRWHGARATATFGIPRTYTGGELGTPLNPALPVKPGSHYSFATYPAAICDVGFTVTPG